MDWDWDRGRDKDKDKDRASAIPDYRLSKVWVVALSYCQIIFSEDGQHYRIDYFYLAQPP